MTDEFYIQRCIDLALKGIGTVAPNPMVGVVIVHNDVIIGEGFHEEYGQAHAEVNAINAVKDQSKLKDSTIFVSLEPCAHFGKTPPCSDLIVQKLFKRVVIGCVDPNSKVAGKGIEKLKNAGINVSVGILENECRELNKRFFTFHEKERPYVILKWAQTKDGFMDKNRNDNDSGVNWITQTETKKLVHQWRSEEASILVGKMTALNDNPSLTVREVEGNNPIRIVLDSNLEVPSTSAVFSNDSPTIVFNTLKRDVADSVEWIVVDKITPSTILSELYRKNILSVFIEGGKQVLESFITEGCWDEARILIGTSEWKEGVEAPIVSSDHTQEYFYGKDLVRTIYNW